MNEHSWRTKLELGAESVELTLNEAVERLCRLDGDVMYELVDGRIRAYMVDREISSDSASEDCEMSHSGSVGLKAK